MVQPACANYRQILAGRRAGYHFAALVILQACFVAWGGPALAQTFNEVTTNLLEAVPVSATNAVFCGNLVGTGTDRNSNLNQLGPQLESICRGGTTIPGGGGGSLPGTSASGSGASTINAARQLVQKRLDVAREAEGEQPTPGGGASSDFEAEILPGVGVFISTGFEYLSKSNNRYEDGYKSNNVNVTLGADYRVTDWLTTGVAFNYIYTDAEFDDGGGVDTNTYGGLLFGTVNPVDNAFIDVVLGYARNNFDQKRQARYTNELGTTFEGPVRADYDGNEYSAGAHTGYDFVVDNITFGPRAGVDFIRFDSDNYKEKGDTGLELRVSDNDQTSLQSRFGAFASIALSTSFGVIVPQLNAAWVHEYLNDSRNINARFAQDNRANPTEFKYKRESPERNWGEIGVGVSAVLANNWQPFTNFSTFVGNARFNSYAGTLGVRKDF
jgi:outer membrane autotransporter protein